MAACFVVLTLLEKLKPCFIHVMVRGVNEAENVQLGVMVKNSRF